MIVLVNRFILPKHISGVALWPFVIIKESHLKVDAVFMNHERIHLRQQLELLVLPFYLWYGVEYVIRLLYCRNRHTAYRSICFEREAYEKEGSVLYLRQRRFWSFLRYL